MNDTDKHTPDPTPALLPPARLDRIRERAPDPHLLWSHLVVSKHEVAPVKTFCFRSYEEAADLYDRAAAQWNEVFLVSVLRGPRIFGTPEQPLPPSDMAALLRHLDALQAPAVEDGGERGRRLYEAMTGFEMPPATWALYRVGIREQYERGALALDAHGYARGVAAGEAERARATREGIDIGRAQGWKEANVEIDRLVKAREERDATIASLTAELADVRAIEVNLRDSCRILGINIEERDAEIEGLRREVASECALTEELRAMEAEALASADRWKAASERHEREAAEARAAAARVEAALNSSIRAYHEQVEEKASLLAAARLDGAQKERRLCLLDCANEADSKAGQAIAERIRARTEGRQG